MDKLVEREHAPRVSPLATAPALAVQFFLIPLAVVGVVVLIYAGFRSMLADERAPSDYLNEIRLTRGERRWPAAYELSRLMADPQVQAKDPGLAGALVKAFTESADDDPRVRRYLALAIGRLRNAPSDAVPALVTALDDGDSETRIAVIWALGALGDRSVVPKLRELYASDDPGVRKMVVYALGVLPGTDQQATLRTALSDPAVDVEWNAAVALADQGSADAVPVLRRMLDREYVRARVTRTPNPSADVDPVSEVLISGLRAAAKLKNPALVEPVTVLSRTDPSLKVRQAALEALR